MTIIEQIKAEIERRMKELGEAETDYREEGCDSISALLISGISELQKILSFLSALESEKPIEVLEEEIQKYLESKGVGYGGWIDGWKDEDLREIARHFAKWGAEHLGSSEIPNDLEEAANVYSNCYSNPDGALARAARRAYITGAKWHREQMMKDAVEGEVVQDLKGVNRVKSFGKIPEGLHFGDKVRIIIEKED